MKITRVESDKGYSVVTVVVEPVDYEKSVAEKLREYRMKASLPGFRPGKVPASLIQKRFARPVLAEEVNNLLSHNLTNYLQEEKLSILGDPLPSLDHQKPINWETDTSFEFVFDIAVSPEVSVDLSATKAFDYYRIVVDEKMVDENLESVRMNFGTNEEAEVVEEKSSVRGDFVQLDGNGEKLEGGVTAEGVLIAVDLMKEEEARQALIGKKSGDMVVFDPVAVFQNRHEVGHMLNISHEAAEELSGNFSFTVRSVLNFRKADLNDELYTKIYGPDSGIATEEEFRSRLATEIAAQLAHSSDQKFAFDARESLVSDVQFDLPETFLRRWLREVNKEMTDEQIDKDFDGFLKDLRWQLIKNKLIRDHEINVTEEEVTDMARTIAVSQFRQYGINDLPAEMLENYVKQILGKEEDRERLVRRLFEDKVFAVIREKGTIAEKEVSSDEFSKLAGNKEETEE
ncbi:MAG TPA: trigger factor [Prolixibacteraceae bacterium]|nr:trigger factor [Prolixibacteraceae bacterium]